MTTGIKHLYLHVPFCSSICYYCDFAHRVYDERLTEKWLDRLQQEIRNVCRDQYETIYIGGGTPTVLSVSCLKRLLEMMKPYSHECIEYTIEVNPESLDEEKIKLFLEYRINRISMGVQSSDDDMLRFLNRRHTFADVKEKIRMLKDEGMDNISVDLMYSLPSQDLGMLGHTIDDILALDVPHISIYSLTVEEDTVFGKKGIKSLDDDIEADMYELIEKRLTEKGYIHYEVSNYCLKGYASKHNMGYWRYDDFLGVSIGASGKIGNNRYTNTRSFQKYLEGKDIRDEDLHLDRDEEEFEHIMMSLRTIEGLDIADFERRYGCDFMKKYEKGISSPHVEINEGRMICRDLEILNSVLMDFLLYK